MTQPADSQPPEEDPQPQNLDAEESVIGSMLLSPHAIDVAAEALAPADFYRASHGILFQTILDLYGQGVRADAVTVSAELTKTGRLNKVGGVIRVNELAALVPTPASIAHYASIVKEQATLRGLARASLQIRGMVAAPDGRDATTIVDQAEQLLFDLAQARASSDFVAMADLVQASYDEIEALQDSGREFTGTPSGYHVLDRLTSGYQRGNLIVVAARPSMGKSAFVLGTINHVAIRLGLPVALFTMEMSSREVVHRLVSMEAAVEATKIRTGSLAKDDWPKLHSGFDRLTKAPIFVDDAGAPTLLEIRSKARRLKSRHPELALVVVDYLQLMSGEAENRVQEISKISRALKVLAGDLDVPVLAVSQLSRQVEQRHDKRPILSDLRESGSIEQDGDLVIFLYRDEYYNPEEADQQGIAEVHLAKQRNGPTGTVKLAFVKRFAKFTEMALPSDVGRQM